MDDDLTFGASVWATPEPAEEKPAPPSEPKRKTPAPLTLEDDFDDAPFNDFDDFGPPVDNAQFEAKDDDFGDFEDFGEAVDIVPESAFQDAVFQDPTPIAGPSFHRPWKPVQLDPASSYQDIQEEVYDTLNPIWANEDISRITTDDPMREVEGVGQILVNPSSRQMHKLLLQAPSSTRPTNWTRSRIRRQHLISLGIPVNLDEVLPKANGKPLPTLEIRTRPMSAPPERGFKNSSGGSKHPSRSGTPQPGGGPQSNIVAQFGPKPVLDTVKINRLLELEPEYLTMQPLPNLERILQDLKMQTASTSNVLTYLLQSREVLQQDSETYNGLIANLVSEMAQKVKSGKPGVTRSMSRHGR